MAIQLCKQAYLLVTTLLISSPATYPQALVHMSNIKSLFSNNITNCVIGDFNLHVT